MSTHDQTQAVRQIDGLGEISDRYDAILCDIWGVLHNGVAAFPSASDALAAFRRRGGAVVLITNAPRPSAPIRRQLLKLGVRPDAFDAIATSGDVTIGLIVERIDEPVLHIGPDARPQPVRSGGEAAGRPPRLVGLEEARYALCTGLRDDVTETLDDYEAELRAHGGARDAHGLRQSGHRDSSRRSARSIAPARWPRRYEALGGAVVYAGKPHPPIYRRALALAETARGGAGRQAARARRRRRHEDRHRRRGARGAGRACSSPAASIGRRCTATPSTLQPTRPSSGASAPNIRSGRSAAIGSLQG